MKKFVSNNDLRITKTRKSLYASLTHLIQNKGYDSIIVQDILDHAKVGRSTFYSHYHDKDELLVSGIDQLKEQLDAPPPGLKVDRSEILPFSLMLFTHGEEFRPVYKALLMSNARSLVNNRFHEMLTQLILARLSFKKSHVPKELLASSLASLFLSTLNWWMNEKSKMSPSDVNQIFNSMVKSLI